MKNQPLNTIRSFYRTESTGLGIALPVRGLSSQSSPQIDIAPLMLRIIFSVGMFLYRHEEKYTRFANILEIIFYDRLDCEMDAVDTKILMLLQEDASISIAELAQKVNLSQTPCWKRVQRLEASGVIQKRVALVDPEKVGLGLTVFVSIETSDHSGTWLERFAEFVSAMPEVMEFYRMAGDVDYMLRVVVSDMAAYDRFYKRLIEAIPLKNVTSRFAMQRVKSTTAYVLSPSERR